MSDERVFINSTLRLMWNDLPYSPLEAKAIQLEEKAFKPTELDFIHSRPERVIMVQKQYFTQHIKLLRTILTS
jgi:hypothetical protein